jgi:hypothetical protein
MTSTIEEIEAVASASGKPMAMRAYAREYVNRIKQLKIQRDELRRVESEIEALETTLAQLLLDNGVTRGTFNDKVIVQLIPRSRRRTDMNKLKVEHPDIWRECETRDYWVEVQCP